MKMLDLINANGNDPSEILIDFVRFACKHLDLRSVPKIRLIDTIISTSESNSFASYNPTNRIITVNIKGRHIMDVLRSLCHEMVHYRQDLQGELKPNSGKTGSDQENEANSVAGQIMRLYGKVRPELF